MKGDFSKISDGLFAFRGGRAALRGNVRSRLLGLIGLRRHEIRIRLDQFDQLAVALQFRVPSHFVAVDFHGIFRTPKDIGEFLDIHGILLILGIHLQKVNMAQAEGRKAAQLAKVQISRLEVNGVIGGAAEPSLPNQHSSERENQNDEND